MTVKAREFKAMSLQGDFVKGMRVELQWGLEENDGICGLSGGDRNTQQARHRAQQRDKADMRKTHQKPHRPHMVPLQRWNR
jgi:hypothetical protein